MTTARTIPWRVVARRAGRNDMPAILFTYWERLPAQDKPKALSEAWGMAEYPEILAEPDLWIAAFDEVGYMVDGKFMDRGDDPDLPETVTLWRGAVPERRNGMSWSLNRDQALWFATRWDGMEGTSNAYLYRIEIPHDYVLARLTGRHENEAVVDTSTFEDEEYELITP